MVASTSSQFVSEPPAAFDDDYVVWLERQALLLREGRFAQLDVDMLIMELDDIVGNQRRELRSRLRILIMHLLKCQFQPERKLSSGASTLLRQRDEIESLFRQSPSLRSALVPTALDAYPAAVRGACKETGLAPSAFPVALPYTAQQLLDHDFEP